MATLDDKTIQDFDDQWTRYSDNEGWYGSLELFQDIIDPLIDAENIAGKRVIDIGSGTGRIVGMLLKAGASHVDAVEPAEGAFARLKENVAAMERGDAVTCINARGDAWEVAEPADYVFSIGVIQFIPEPDSTVKRCFEALKPGGEIFFWLYSHEGNELYLSFIRPIRAITTRLPHIALVTFNWLLYLILVVYRYCSLVLPLPLRRYINQIWWPMTPRKRRLVIYDQLNPSYAKYHKRHEAIELLEKAGFTDVKAHHRHGYSWCVWGRKPA